MLTTQQIILMSAGLIGGLALFLYGMNTMSSGLTQFAGGTLETIIEKVTANRYVSWLFGTVVTALVQSSSATTVMTVGLVNSGIMKLSQAVGLILGANLGTTATAWLLSLNGIQSTSTALILLKPSTIMPFVALLGVALQMFARSDRKKLVGSILIGFGTMMIGMAMMSSSMTPLKEVPAFEEMLVHFSMPALGFLFAILFTMIIQSSDAAIGILQALALAVGVNCRMAVVIVCGAQIGTCITPIIASLGSGRNAKRTAMIQLFYNLIKNVPFIIVLLILDSVTVLPFMSVRISAVGIAAFHSAINLVFSLIILPLSEVLVKLAIKVVPYTEEEKQEQADTLQYLDPLLFRNPGLAIAQARKAADDVSDSVLESFSACLDGRYKEAGQDCVRTIRYLRQADSYMTEITKKQLLEEESREIRYLQMICGDFSVISNQIASIIQTNETLDAVCSSTAADLKVYGEAVQETLEIVAEGFKVRSRLLADTVQAFREVIVGLSHQINARQIRRVHKGESSSEEGIPFMEICFSFERIMDRCDHAAGNLLAYETVFSRPLDPRDLEIREKKHREIRSLFRDKYSMLKEPRG